MTTPSLTTNASAATTAQYPKYTIRPFFRDADALGAKEASGYDVWEQTGPQSEAIISPCDTLHEAQQEMERIKNL